MKMLFIVLLAIVIPIVGSAWSGDWDPETALGVKIEKVYEGADEITQDEQL